MKPHHPSRSARNAQLSAPQSEDWSVNRGLMKKSGILLATHWRAPISLLTGAITNKGITSMLAGGVALALLAFATDTQADVTGDYRSNATAFNWSTAGSWQKFDGTTWNTATVKPGAGDNVFIQSG